MKFAMVCSAADGGRSGISTYLLNLARELAGSTGKDELHLFIQEGDDFLNETGSVATTVIPAFFAPPILNILWHIAILPFLVWYNRIDVLLLPAGNRRLVFYCPCPVVAVVHDISQLHVSGKYDPTRMFYAVNLLPRLMRRMDRLITVSSCTARDVVETAGVSPEKIRVVYNGIDHHTFSPCDTPSSRRRLRERYGITGPYILYTSRIEHPGKNHVNLLRAFDRLCAMNRDIRDFKLVCAGASWNGAGVVFNEVSRLSIGKSVIFTGYADSSDLPLLYSCAKLFVFPSLFEGFGLPVLEAMACATPVACSNTSSLPEVAADCAMYFDPTDVGDITEAMGKVLSNPSLSAELVRAGLERAACFSWSGTAAGTLEVLRELEPGAQTLQALVEDGNRG